MPMATIAKIEGRCRGGGSEMALACDMRFAAIGKAVLGQPEVGVGIIPALAVRCVCRASSAAAGRWKPLLVVLT